MNTNRIGKLFIGGFIIIVLIYIISLYISNHEVTIISSMSKIDKDNSHYISPGLKYNIEERIFRLDNDSIIIGDIHQAKAIDDNFILVDHYFAQQVYKLTDAGRIHLIGRRGEGPGEYIFPTIGSTIMDTIIIVSEGTKRLELYTTNGDYVRSQFLDNLGTAVLKDMKIDMNNNLHILNVTRYNPFSVHVYNTSGKKINDYAPLDELFKLQFDRYHRQGGIVIKDSLVYLAYNHKYELHTYDIYGNYRGSINYESPFYIPPDYEQAKIVNEGRLGGMEFRSTFTQICGVFFLDPDIFVFPLRNWKNSEKWIDHLEFRNKQGELLIRYKVNDGEELLGTDDNRMLFVREGELLDGDLLSNPQLIVRTLNLYQQFN